MIENIIKAAILNRHIYPEFRNRPELVIQSLGTVAITAFSSAIYLHYKGTVINPESDFARLQMMAVAFSTKTHLQRFPSPHQVQRFRRSSI